MPLDFDDLDNNPYAPSRPAQEPPAEPPSLIARQHQLKAVMPLVDFVSRYHNELPLNLSILTKVKPFQDPILRMTTQRPLQEEYLNTIQQYYEIEKDTQNLPQQGIAYYRIKGCDLSKPCYKPHPFNNNIKADVRFAAQVIHKEAVIIQSILTKTSPQALSQITTLIQQIDKHMAACEAATNNLLLKDATTYSADCLRLELAKHGNDSTISDTEFVGRTLSDAVYLHENFGLSEADKQQLVDSASIIADTYQRNEFSINKALHHVLYMQAIDGLEIAPEKKPGKFDKVTQTALGVARKFWPKKLDLPDQQIE